MLRCIFETGSREVAQLTAKGVTASYIKLGYCNVYSGDCSALNYVLQHRKKRLGLDMDNNNISDYGVKQLQPSLCTMTVVRLVLPQKIYMNTTIVQLVTPQKIFFINYHNYTVFPYIPQKIYE